jgi:hypothetical protein
MNTKMCSQPSGKAQKHRKERGQNEGPCREWRKGKESENKGENYCILGVGESIKSEISN